MVADWVVVELEPAGAARSGLPARLAVPREVAERGDPIERVRVAEWARAFVAGHADHELAPVLLALVGGRALPPPGRAPAARGALRGGRAGARARDRADAVRRGVALQPRRRPAALRRAGAALAALDEAEWAYGGESAYHVLRGQIWEALDEQMRAVLAYERALELAPGDGFVLERLEALGALMRIEGPDGEVFWLTPGDFERVMRHELASASNDPDQLVALGDRLLGGGHVALAASRPSSRSPAAGTPRRLGARGADAAALGRDLQARDALARAAALDPSNVAVARALVQREDDPEGELPRAHAEVQRRPTLRLPGSCSATSWPPRRSRARRSAPMRTLSTSIRRCRARITRAKRCACSADHRRRYAPAYVTPCGRSRSSRRRERRVTSLRPLVGR